MSSMPQAFPQASTWHFQAGAARLSVRAAGFGTGELPPCAAEAAVVLDLAGELLDALADAGLAPAAAWLWAGTAETPDAAGAQASWCGAEAQARLTLPWALLRAQPQEPAVPGLQWLPTPAECVLAGWQLEAAELAALEPGGLLLLDGPPARRLRARGEAAGAASGEPRWQLVARWEPPLAVEAVMGWGTAAPALPPLCQLVDTHRPDTVLARGRLLPWGSGQALRIDATTPWT